MKFKTKKGFLLIIVCSAAAVLILITSAIVSFGCSELLATRMRNDLLIAEYYVAISGVEQLYANMKSSDNITWNPSTSGTITVGSNAIGTYQATAARTVSNEFCIASTGTVGGRTAMVTVKLGYLADYSGAYTLAAVGAVTLIGGSTQAKIMVDGPIVSNSTVTTIGEVSISGSPQKIENAGLPKVDFWNAYPTTKLNTNADADYVTGVDPDMVTRSEAIDQNKVGIFDTDDVNSDGIVDQRDAFIYYYTTYLNNSACPANTTHQTLNIGAGQSRYYEGNQTFTTDSIPDTVPIIFVNGDAEIATNDGATADHTVVVNGNLTLHQPSNGPGDRNTYIVFGNVNTDGEMGNSGGTRGDLIIFANGNIVKTGGGKMNASLYSNGTLVVDTAGSTGKKHMMVSKLTTVWSSTDKPLGLPPDYPGATMTGFTVKHQTDYPPAFQRQ